jgi:O-antigen/teichoic acid export membrane protein
LAILLNLVDFIRNVQMVKRLLKSESLRAAIGFGGGGIGFAVGNIFLARILTPAGFGVVTLALALNQFGLTCGPFGLEIVANRHRPRVDRRLASLALFAASTTAVVVAIVAGAYYHLSGAIVGLLLAMVVGSATNRVCIALFQGENAFWPAMLLSQIHNYVLLLIAVLAIALSHQNEVFVVSIVTGAYLATSLCGWWWAHRTVNSGRIAIHPPTALREGFAALGFGVAVQLLSQCERLAIPKVGSLSMLGTYAVLAAMVGSPFRMLQAGTSFSLLPRLRAVKTRADARGILLREAAAALTVSAASVLIILVVSPYVFNVLLNGKYAVSANLMAVSIGVGLAKVWEGFSTTAVAACGSARMLTAISVLSWVCLVLAAAGMAFGARYGLAGILYGAGIAWVLLALAGTYLGVLSFRARFGAA